MLRIPTPGGKRRPAGLTGGSEVTWLRLCVTDGGRSGSGVAMAGRRMGRRGGPSSTSVYVPRGLRGEAGRAADKENFS